MRLPLLVLPVFTSLAISGGLDSTARLEHRFAESPWAMVMMWWAPVRESPGVCSDLASELLQRDGEGDHVHLLVDYPLKVSVSSLVNFPAVAHRLKASSATWKSRRQHDSRGLHRPELRGLRHSLGQ
jgi:hypothetical protein